MIKRSIHQKKRTIVHNQGSQNVQQAIGPIYPDMEIYGISAGQFHFINVIEYMVSQIDEPLTLTVASWTIAKFEASRLATIGQLDRVDRLRIIVDTSMLNLVPKSFSFLRSLIIDDSIRFLRCHCKFAVIRSETWNIAIRTSMNLNENKRLENFEISDCAILTDYMNGIVDDIFSTPFDLKNKVRIDDLGKGEVADEIDGLLINISDFW